jgi:hypothetical protein
LSLPTQFVHIACTKQTGASKRPVIHAIYA